LKMEAARRADKQGLYRVAIDAAMEALPFIDGMMQYAQKYLSEDVATIGAIEMVVYYSPLLLDSQTLDSLESLLETRRRIERNSAEDLGEKVEKARGRIWDNHRLWSRVEANPGCRQDELRDVLGGEQQYWRSVAESWEHMGLVRRVADRGSYLLFLATRTGQVVSGKCPACGHVAEAPKGMFFENMSCPQCKADVLFVLLGQGAN
jgi:hypothetical protein